MESKRLFAQQKNESGLVLVFPAGVQGLFNTHVHRLVREVGDRLDGVFVTYALNGGATPSLSDAMNAAKFAGCNSAVVVHSGDPLAAIERIAPNSDTLWVDHHDPDDLEDTVRLVVEAYNTVGEQSGMAA